MIWLTVWTALRKIPMTALIVVGILAALVIGAWAIEKHGEHKAELATKLEPLQKARAMGTVQIRIDSVHSSVRHKIADVAHARADTAHRRAVAVDEGYVLARQKLQPVPDSVLRGLPQVAVVAIEQRDSLLVRADLAVAGNRSDARASRNDAAAQIAAGVADSAEKSGLKLQVARTDSVADLALQEAHPRCGMKCGVTIGAVAVVTVALTVLHFLGR